MSSAVASTLPRVTPTPNEIIATSSDSSTQPASETKRQGERPPTEPVEKKMRMRVLTSLTPPMSTPIGTPIDTPTHKKAKSAGYISHSEGSGGRTSVSAPGTPLRTGYPGDTAPPLSLSPSGDDQQARICQALLPPIRRSISDFSVVSTSMASSERVVKVNTEVVPEFSRLIDLADRILSGREAATKTSIEVKASASVPVHMQTYTQHLSPAPPLVRIIPESAEELRDVIGEIGEYVQDMAEKSRKSPLTEVPPWIERLTGIFYQLIERYRTLQEAPSKDFEKDVEGLFSKYCYTSLREYFWTLSTKLPNAHCHKQKKDSLSCLIRCLEIDPINAASQPDLPKLFGHIVEYLESDSQQLDVETTKSFLQVFTSVSEVWAWHNENGTEMKFNHDLIERARKVLKAINIRHPEPHSERGTEQWHKAWDMRLQCNIARAAIHNFTTDRSTLKELARAASPLIEGVRHAVSAEKDLVGGVQGVFRGFYNVYKMLKGRMTDKKWYVNLLAVRRVVHKMTNDLDKVQLLQAALKQKITRAVTWKFAGGVLHLLGRLGLESQNQDVIRAICGGLRTKDNASLPGLVHFRHRQVEIYRGFGMQVPHENNMAYLAQSAQNYARLIFQRFPEDKQHAKVMRLINAWFPSINSATSKLQINLSIDTTTFSRNLEQIDNDVRSGSSEHKSGSSSSKMSPRPSSKLSRGKRASIGGSDMKNTVAAAAASAAVAATTSATAIAPTIVAAAATVATSPPVMSPPPRLASSAAPPLAIPIQPVASTASGRPPTPPTTLTSSGSHPTPQIGRSILAAVASASASAKKTTS